ncbi:DUF945 family protein [Halomonas sp. NO4]|uniref:DUF945 family protein n=1 Tax=Halomonas sp. NO4 TaxID=2484813 RepID=UPI0013D6870D|nr:DUF945 family protein [Halomonas sp. NO4]
MRKERLIVPVLVVLLLAWLAGQGVSSLLFERELTRALDDLAARGELAVERDEVEQGWWSSSGRIRLAPLFGDAWQLELGYEAQHGVLSTELSGEAIIRHGADGKRLFGDSLPAATPRWQASYRTLSGVMEGGVRLAPFRITQEDRELDFGGGQFHFSGVYGDWQLQGRLDDWRLTDGEVWLASGPVRLQSHYAYTEGAQAFTQQDRLELASLTWHQPSLELDVHDLVVVNRMTLDDRELRLRLDLDMGEVLTADQVLLTGGLEAELSRLHGDALRSAMQRLRALAASADPPRDARALLAELEPLLLGILQDSPRLDLFELALDSPMMNLAARVDGSLFFDGRRLEPLSLVALDDPAMQARWRRRLDGDFVWHDLPTVVALWLGLPLDTRTLQVDISRGQVWLNGRPLSTLR